MRHGQSKSNVYGVNDSFGDPENHLTEKEGKKSPIL